MGGVAALEAVPVLELTSKQGKLPLAGVRILQAVLHRPHVAACLVKLNLRLGGGCGVVGREGRDFVFDEGFCF